MHLCLSGRRWWYGPIPFVSACYRGCDMRSVYLSTRVTIFQDLTLSSIPWARFPGEIRPDRIPDCFVGFMGKEVQALPRGGFVHPMGAQVHEADTPLQPR